MMKRIFYAILVLTACAPSLMNAQIAINRDGTSPDPSSVLEIKSTEAGFLMPRLTNIQKIGLSPAPDGMIIYQTTPPTGYYLSRGGTSYEVNSLQDYRNEVTMNSPGVPIVTGNGTFGTQGITVTDVGVGVMEVQHAPFPGGPPVKIVTPNFIEVPSPPSIPGDLCATSFTNNCGQTGGGATYQHALVVGVISPPSLVPANTTPTPSYRLCMRLPTGNLCQDAGTGDYKYYPPWDGSSGLPPTFRCAFGGITNPYNNTTGIDPGDNYELLLRGNTQVISANYTALSVWVDWNQDADFFDAGEAIYASNREQWDATPHRNTGEVRGPFTVPANAVDGTCTMRVIASQIDNNQQPCLVTTNGSAQDFEFYISNGSAPTYPAENIHCSFSDETNSSFYVRCYDNDGTPVNAKVHILIEPN